MIFLTRFCSSIDLLGFFALKLGNTILNIGDLRAVLISAHSKFLYADAFISLLYRDQAQGRLRLWAA